ncbi:MAG: SDR family NAD(P)-dependent oxidoreductase [Bacteroidales bacterium]|jgi:NADP-dependent 3-hydroxy acid dehydrogenase YdfG|nr:SDR family NAD(P)-dependent oxidoreductase [Bacteroidales bacterium]MDD4214879.1 SDR family NAD(P)-dependent oxidoreductase [Bacteroidales bacterium]
MATKKKTVIVTGASSGIGKACATIFAQNNFKVIVTGRRLELLKSLAASLKKKYDAEVLVLNFDVRNYDEVALAIKKIPAQWKSIDILINNAGLAAGLEPINEGKIDDWTQMIDTNIKGLLYVSRCIIPGMIHRKKGHIINIGSIAGKESYLNGNVYCATKAAVDSLTKSMRIDLLEHNIKVSQIAPGAAQTEFSEVRFKGDKVKAKKAYEGFTPLTGDDIAGAVYFVASLPAHVNVNDLLIMPTSQANTTHLLKK